MTQKHRFKEKAKTISKQKIADHESKKRFEIKMETDNGSGIERVNYKNALKYRIKIIDGERSSAHHKTLKMRR